MTLFAGVLRLDRGTGGVDEATRAALRAAISRRADEPRVEHETAGLYVVSVDVGAFGAPGVHVDGEGRITIVAGAPHFVDSPSGTRRDAEVRRLGEDLAARRDERLRAATGSYCVVHADPASRRLVLATDRLGVRPVYFAQTADALYFATALRILEALPGVRKTMDVRAVTEAHGLGVANGDRTPYEEIRVLRTGELLEVTDGAPRRTRYWRWDAVPRDDRGEDALLDEAHARFLSAVDRRLTGDGAAAAYLSGGLDSRCIVAALRARGATVHTFNFSFRGTQDQRFGSAFAEAIGAVHHEHTKLDTAALGLTRRMAATLEADAAVLREVPRPRLVWSGDGGSVGVGHVLVTGPVVEAMRRGDREGAVAAHLAAIRGSVVTRLLRPEVARRVARVLEDGILEELADIDSGDPGRDFHLFLMLNDQRRHLAGHFEQIDEHRLELQLPFYDAAFLETIIGAPLDACLFHRFYTKWLSRFQPAVTAVPWQAYPNHVPCPLPLPPDVSYQWKLTEQRKDIRTSRRRDAVRKAQQVLSARPFPGELLDRGFLLRSMLLHRFGIRDYGYVANAAELYYRYWSRANGR